MSKWSIFGLVNCHYRKNNGTPSWYKSFLVEKQLSRLPTDPTVVTVSFTSKSHRIYSTFKIESLPGLTSLYWSFSSPGHNPFLGLWLVHKSLECQLFDKTFSSTSLSKETNDRILNTTMRRISTSMSYTCWCFITLTNRPQRIFWIKIVEILVIVLPWEVQSKRFLRGKTGDRNHWTRPRLLLWGINKCQIRLGLGHDKWKNVYMNKKYYRCTHLWG